MEFSIESRPREIIIKKGEVKIPNFSKAGSFRGFVLGQLSKYSKEDSPEGLQATFILNTVLQAYNHFHPEATIDQEVTGWHKKSTIDIIRDIDKITIIKWQRPDKFSEPKEVKTEIYKNEINAIIESIKFLHEKFPEGIRTRDLAMMYSKILRLGHSSWDVGDKPFETDRREHNKLNILLCALSEMEFISYIGGITKLLDKKISLKEVLL